MSTPAHPGCPLEATLRVVGGKWKCPLLWHLRQAGELRFGELRRRIPNATEKMVIEHLKELVEDGLVARTQFDEVPPRVCYRLTPKGETLGRALDALADWGIEHLAPISGGGGA